VGAAIRKSGIPRDQIFLTTKLWNNSHHPDDVEVALDASLKRLGTDYLDLYLMHWPSSFERGSNVFPKGEGGKAAKGGSDYVDVGCATDCFLN
jgi:alcohol dehydrogenase (NADP+)